MSLVVAVVDCSRADAAAEEPQEEWQQQPLEQSWLQDARKNNARNRQNRCELACL